LPIFHEIDLLGMSLLNDGGAGVIPDGHATIGSLERLRAGEEGGKSRASVAEESAA
jgi:hypothetical protein